MAKNIYYNIKECLKYKKKYSKILLKSLNIINNILFNIFEIKLFEFNFFLIFIYEIHIKKIRTHSWNFISRNSGKYIKIMY